ncbi:hypothetical protein ACVWZD_001097 [Streptomyces sp. TE3672]
MRRVLISSEPSLRVAVLRALLRPACCWKVSGRTGTGPDPGLASTGVVGARPRASASTTYASSWPVRSSAAALTRLKARHALIVTVVPDPSASEATNSPVITSPVVGLMAQPSARTYCGCAAAGWGSGACCVARRRSVRRTCSWRQWIRWASWCRRRRSAVPAVPRRSAVSAQSATGSAQSSVAACARAEGDRRDRHSIKLAGSHLIDDCRRRPVDGAAQRPARRILPAPPTTPPSGHIHQLRQLEPGQLYAHEPRADRLLHALGEVHGAVPAGTSSKNRRPHRRRTHQLDPRNARGDVQPAAPSYPLHPVSPVSDVVSRRRARHFHSPHTHSPGSREGCLACPVAAGGIQSQLVFLPAGRRAPVRRSPVVPRARCL